MIQNHKKSNFVGPPFSQVCPAGSWSKYVPYSGQLREFVRQQEHHCRLCFVAPTVWLSLALMRNGWQVRCCYGSFIPRRLAQTLWRHGSHCHCLPVPDITGFSVWKLHTSNGGKKLWFGVSLVWFYYFFSTFFLKGSCVLLSLLFFFSSLFWKPYVK